jgi:hypothetical protein
MCFVCATGLLTWDCQSDGVRVLVGLLARRNAGAGQDAADLLKRPAK